jgi:threonine aldolase
VAIADFYSDTKTRPTLAMREAMMTAEVGDEQAGEDPTTRALEARVAELLGKEAAVFLPSGTMCNEIALRVHCAPGDEVICEATCHIVNFEAGGPAALGGVMIRTVEGERGIFGADQALGAIRSPSRYAPVSRLVCVEQTANHGGGAVWPVEALDAVAEAAHGRGLATHMDGARLMNAAVKAGVPAARLTTGFDSCWIDFSKGLGAPVGAVLAGSRAFIDRAWVLKQQWGGALRQSGILAAAGLYALDHHVDRLAEDHALAAELGRRIAGLALVERVLPVETNIVIFDVAAEAPGADAIAGRLKAQGLKASVFGPRRLRVVTHLDVTAQDGDRLCAALEAILGGHR